MSARLTYEEVKHFIEIESGSGCKLLDSNYINSVTEMSIRCKCGIIFSTTYNQFKNMNKRQCNQCGKELSISKRNLPYEEVKNYIEGTNGNGCKLISNIYNNQYAKLTLECSCGNRFEASFADFKYDNKKQCNVCGRKGAGALSYANVKKFIEIDSDSGCKLLSSEYHGMKDILNIECKCGNQFTTNLSQFKFHNKRQCNDCGEKIRSIKKSKTNEQFIEAVKLAVGDEYNFLDEYQGMNKKIKCVHNKCGHEYSVMPNDFLRGRRCPKCFRKYALTTHEFNDRVLSLVGDEYTLISEYKNMKEKLLFKHNVCNNTFEILPGNFLNGNRCPYCFIKSKGEIAVEKFLQDNNYRYKREFVIAGLVSKTGRVLRFDFAIFLDEVPLILIEYDGLHHYQPIRLGMTEIQAQEYLNKTKKHDQMKNEHCQQHGIPLIRIPYWEFDNIETILEEKLKEIVKVNNIREVSN